MIITCDQCGARYKLDVSSISRAVFKVRCTKCNHRFEVSRKLDDASDLFQNDPACSPGNCQVLSISNQKGGVAKTSTCLSLGMALADLGRRVLLIDFDVQANLTTCLGLPQNLSSFFDLLESGAVNIASGIHETRFENLHVLPSNSKMALLSKHYMYRPNFEQLLHNQLQLNSGLYDYILLDTPPSLGFCTINALVASNRVIIPTPCDYLSLKGIQKIEDVIQAIEKKTGHRVDSRILVTMYDPDSTASTVIYRKIREKFHDRLLKTVIELDEKIRESQIVKLPVSRYSESCKSARQYMMLAREIERLTETPT